jgi:opacity protein-like surface antigen
MKPFSIALVVVLAFAGSARADDEPRTPLSRGDVHFVIGWQNLEGRQPQASRGNQWINSIFWGGAGAGRYWTDHLKSQVDIGAGSEGDQYRYATTIVEGQPTGSSSRFNVSGRSVALAQHYQFFRNQWIHPYVGGGAAIERLTTTERHEPVTIYDSVARQPRVVLPQRTEGPTSRTRVTPFATTGFKAYMTRRAFFTSDVRVMVDHGIDEVLFRFGFGTDF